MKKKIFDMSLRLLTLGLVTPYGTYAETTSETKILEEGLFLEKHSSVNKRPLMGANPLEKPAAFLEKSLRESQFIEVQDLSYSEIFDHHKAEQIKYASRQVNIKDLPQAVEKLRSMVLDKTILEQLTLSLNKKINLIQDHYSAYCKENAKRSSLSTKGEG